MSTESCPTCMMPFVTYRSFIQNAVTIEELHAWTDRAIPLIMAGQYEVPHSYCGCAMGERGADHMTVYERDLYLKMKQLHESE